ncbi:MAG: ATP-binding protein [gamma proteobacterium symbiont of Bathyaustriella thionipta]|nr:ATP-binding protein [gamma proteobacterium symbiont of Bathyaustriella thionipta]
MDSYELMKRAEAFLTRLEGLFENQGNPGCDWQHPAYRWRRQGTQGRLQAVRHPHRVKADDLLCMSRQKAEVLRNTRQFVEHKPANNVLLWGSRGTGKSTLIKAAFNEFSAQSLRLIEVDKTQLLDLPDLLEQLYERPERFILYCDDLSFEQDDSSYKALKAVLEGSICAPPENVLIYASSNRRHLLPEYQRENQQSHLDDGELHHSEAVEEKISLSERFGLCLSFYPFSQDEYLQIVQHWLKQLGCAEWNNDIRAQALKWALARGSRSGRVARQFSLDYAGRESSLR